MHNLAMHGTNIKLVARTLSMEGISVTHEEEERTKRRKKFIYIVRKKCYTSKNKQSFYNQLS
jgi:hypothetical protein